MTPSEFWTSTMDEVLYYIQGRMDRLRFQRDCTWLIHASMVGTQKAVDKLRALPLPFDEEYKSNGKKEENELLHWYHNTVKSWQET